MGADPTATWQSILTTLFAPGLAVAFGNFTFPAGDWLPIALGAGPLLTVGLLLWAGFFKVALESSAAVSFVHLLRGLGVSVLGFAIPAAAITVVQWVFQARFRTLWTPANVLETVWSFAMQVQALREIANLSFLKAIGLIILGLILLVAVSATVFLLTFRVY
jgi:hypothetical protein